MKLSHLFNIDNCVYNKIYFKLLVVTSHENLPGLKDYICCVMDGTHVKIAKSTRVDNPSYEITLNATKSSSILSLSMFDRSEWIDCPI